MSRPAPGPAERAARLLRWYPADWRARYGEEFRELLVAEITENPRSLRRSADVAAGGLMARVADAGLAGPPAGGTRRSERSLATFGCATAAALTVAISMWSQLDIARRWSEPATSATRAAIVIMTIGLFTCLGAASIGAVPVAWRAAVEIRRRRTPALYRPALLSGAGTAVVLAGGLYLRSGWAGSSPAPWGHQAWGLDAAAGFLWASTMAVSAYWAHPAILFSLPAGEIAWMVVSPLALVASVAGAARTVRRLELPAPVLSFTGWMARGAALGLGLFLLGTLVWLVDGGPGPGNLFQAGTVDLVGLAVVATTLGLTARTLPGIA